MCFLPSAVQSSYHLCDSAREEAEREKEAQRRPGDEGLLTPDELRVYIQCAQKLKPLLTGKKGLRSTSSRCLMCSLSGHGVCHPQMRVGESTCPRIRVSEVTPAAGTCYSPFSAQNVG